MRSAKSRKTNKKGKKSYNKSYKIIPKEKSLLIKRKINKENISKLSKVKYCFKIFLGFIFIISFIFAIFKLLHKRKDKAEKIYGLSFEQKMNDYSTKKFAIFGRGECPTCGLFSYYIVFLGCINKYVQKGYIPIIDIQNYNNVYNRGNKTIKNPWELFFYQTNNYTLEEVKTYANNSKYVVCTGKFERPNETNVIDHIEQVKFWHDLQKKYMPIKNEIINEVKFYMKKFFGNSKNVLGVLMRGTDYINRRSHFIPPQIGQVISDVKEMDQKYNYDFIYFTTEDEKIKNKFIPEFTDKIRYLNPRMTVKNINKNITDENEQIKEYHDFLKIYLINIIIISKCLDIVVCRCSGTVGIFVLTEGFRNYKAYNLGTFK